MSELFQIMFDVISPIFIVVGIAAYLGRRFNPDPRTLSLFIVYVFIPALAFNGIATSDLSGGELFGIGGMAIGMAILMAVVGTVILRLFPSERKLDRKAEGAFFLSIILVNAANYGIPLNTFAFGAAGTQRAVVYYVMAVIAQTIFGVYYASRGESSIRQAIMNVFKVPIIYAALLGLVFNLLDLSPPLYAARAIELLAQAAVPGMLVLLGLQLAKTSLRGRMYPIVIATGTRLIAAPLIAFPLALLLGLSGVTFQVAIVESSMPTAVLASALATEFGSDAEFTSAVTLLSTLVSIITLSILLALLM